MTSVKDLGETLRKRQGPAGSGGAGEETPRVPTGSVYTALLVAGGCLALIAGGLLAAIDVVAPDYAWMASNLGRMGIQSGAVLAAGVCLLGLGVLCNAQLRTQRALFASVRQPSGSPQQVEHLEEIRDGLGKVHFALRVLQESTKGLLEVAHEQSLQRETGGHEDAVFHLAASLDQLGLRLEDRLDSQQTGIERRLGTLDAALEETRRRIGEWLELGARAAEAAARDEQIAADGRAARGGRADGERGKGRERTLELPPNEQRELRLPKRIDSRRPHREEELEVVVTLDDDESDEGRRRDRGPRRGTSPTSLGVLDVLDDFSELNDAEDGEDTSSDPSFLFDAELAERLDRLAEEAAAKGSEASEAARTQEKIGQLQALLADANLRKALEGMRRGGGAS